MCTVTRLTAINPHLSSLWLLFFVFDFHFKENDAQTSEAERHLEMGRELIARGQFTEALSHLHAAVEGDPTNYVPHYQRATVFLALGKSKSALPDLNRVIELRPDFTAAWLQRGNILLKQGRLDEAHINFEAVLRREPGNPDALHQYSVIEPLRHDFQMASMLVLDRDYHSAIEVLSRLIEVCPWDPALRETRADCFIAIGELPKAIMDLQPATKLRSDNTLAYYKLSNLYYKLGDVDDALREVRECLKLDPEHKECFPLYKKVKKLSSQLTAADEFRDGGKYAECVEKCNQALKTEPMVEPYLFRIHATLCHCLTKAGEPLEAITKCTIALSISQSVDVLCDRGEAHLAEGKYDEAIRDYDEAVQMDNHADCARKGGDRARKLQKQVSRRDYYAILGVKRTANKKEITKAYRKLAQKWHPDNFDGDEKKDAEKKFIDIASAKEVLTDPEKRQKFDNGEDPLDPESAAGRNFNPFQQGFHPFGNGFQFKFHFN